MSNTTLKILAILFMFIDHLGASLFPQFFFLREIGRLAFPIFAYFIAEGYSKTSSYTRYLRRLSLFAIVSQIPFSMAFSKTYSIKNGVDLIHSLLGKPTMHLNVFFTLAFGLIAIRVWDKEEDKLTKIIAVLSIGFFAKLLHTDYDLYGVMMILFFYVFRNEKVKIVWSQILIYILLYAIPYWTYLMKVGYPISLESFNQGLSLLSLLLLFMYNGKKGRGIQYFFYVFYPLHLLIIGIFHIFVQH